MRNVPEWSIAFFAATAIGAVAVPLNALWNGAELAFGVTDCGAKVLVLDGERIERWHRTCPSSTASPSSARGRTTEGHRPTPLSVDFLELRLRTAPPSRCRHRP
jgi:acyl-CoA synthetase (AMP-forming)/AMP-acid ligase II